MSSNTQRGKADHSAVELFERLAIVAEGHGVPVDRVERLITAEIIADAAERWWTRRGYDMSKGVKRADQAS